MTPEQISSIISAMPEGKRRQACKIIMDAECFNSKFWRLIECGEFGKAAAWVLSRDEADTTAATLADMIWEGGA